MTTETTEKLLDAALMHVPFEGWSEATFRAAVADTGIDTGLARALFPRGGVDLALAHHRRGDELMVERLTATDLSAMRFRDRIAFAVRARIEATGDKEAVRRASALFALPQYAPDGARAIWDTCDLIWTTLGDGSEDFNWYSKRATLSGVYSSTLLFWLGDDSPGDEATSAFLDRRIENVMSIEKFKGKFRDSPLARTIGKGPLALLDRVRAPDQTFREKMPGSTRH